MSVLDPLPLTTAPPKERVANLDNARCWVMLHERRPAWLTLSTTEIEEAPNRRPGLLQCR